MKYFAESPLSSRRQILRQAALLWPAVAAAQSSSPARITVDPKSTGSRVSPLLFGCGVEWPENGNGIYNPANRRNRPEVVAALKKSGVTTLRFPGGILADYYNWRDGIGPMATRPKRANPMDGKVYANNFGTDEFIALCRQVGAEPLITLNAGTGTLEMALSWQKYFRDKGMPVKYFEVGNEIYLAEPRQPATIPGNDKRIYKTAAQYASLFREWAPALRAADPQCLVGAIAGTYNTSKENKGWLDTLLSNAGSQADFLALHNAFAPITSPGYKFTEESRRVDAYRAMYTATVYSGEDMRTVRGRLRSANPASTGRLAITEHFPLFGSGGSQSELLHILDQSRTLAAGIYTASVLHTMMRQSVWMAHYNLALSPWFGALLQDSSSGLIENPHYYVFHLLRDFASSAMARAEVAGPSFNSPAVGVVASGVNTPVLDAVAAVGADGLRLSVINRDLFKIVNAAITVPLAGYTAQAAVKRFGGSAPHAIKGKPLSGSAADRSAELGISNSVWNGRSGAPYAFPPLSVTQFFWTKAR